MSNEFRKEIQNDAVNELLKHKSGTANVAMRLGKIIDI